MFSVLSSDVFSKDDYIGVIELNLSRMLAPWKNVGKVKIEHAHTVDAINIFQMKEARARVVLSNTRRRR